MEMEMLESGAPGAAREERNLQQRLRGLFCCFFHQLGDEQGTRTGGDIAPGDQTVRIAAENLGRINVGFSLLDEEPLKGRASPVRVCSPALPKKRAKPPRSLSQDVLLISSSGEDGDEERENEGGNGLLLTVSGPLAPPTFHLIPSTPSIVADKGQFFDVSPMQVGRKSCEDAEGAQADEVGGSERDPQKKDGKKLRFSHSCQQGASLAEVPRKSESAPPVPFHPSCISGLFATRRRPTPSESY